MAENEQENKIRLNEARRKAVRNKIAKADIVSSEKNPYGGKEEKNQAREYAKNFKGMRSPLKMARTAKDMATAFKEFKLMDIFIYGFAFILAGFKDLLDIAILWLPGVGVAVVVVVTWCISIAIGLLLLFDGISAKRKVARNLTKKFLVLIAGTITEGFLVGLNVFPFEMFTVAVIYWMALAERKNNK